MLKLLLGYENVLSRLVTTGSFGSKVFFKSIFSSEKLVSYQKKKMTPGKNPKFFLYDITTAAEALNYINID